MKTNLAGTYSGEITEGYDTSSGHTPKGVCFLFMMFESFLGTYKAVLPVRWYRDIMITILACGGGSCEK